MSTGTDTEPRDLSERAKDLIRSLHELEDLHPVGSPPYDRVVSGSVYARLEAELATDPTYRWFYRHPGQVKLGAGWEDELPGEHVLIDGRHVVIAAVEPRDDGRWHVFDEDATVHVLPRYTVLDLVPVPAVTE